MNPLKSPYRFVLFVATLVFLSAGFPSPSVAASKAVFLATTTSTQDSGLLDVLIPLFEKESGYIIKTVAVGSGQALIMGQKGEVDVLLVHSPEEEKKFMADGFGSNRRLVMHNDFVVVGPAADPAMVQDATTSVEAFRKIAHSKSLFLSRHDQSGTHIKEMEIWKEAGVTPYNQKWYLQIPGLGMAQTLFLADERKGYTLTDRSTYLAQKNKLKLVISLEGDPRLMNMYHVVEINAAKWPKVNAPGAKAFAEFLVSPKIQKIIASYGVAKYGEPLFFPEADMHQEVPGGQ